jgi:hypothetical protein
MITEYAATIAHETVPATLGGVARLVVRSESIRRAIKAHLEALKKA